MFDSAMTSVDDIVIVAVPGRDQLKIKVNDSERSRAMDDEDKKDI